MDLNRSKGTRSLIGAGHIHFAGRPCGTRYAVATAFTGTYLRMMSDVPDLKSVADASRGRRNDSALHDDVTTCDKRWDSKLRSGSILNLVSSHERVTE
jgi:hypothetical protein